MPSLASAKVAQAMAPSASLLKELGFRCRGTNYYRHIDGCAHVINVQSSAHNSSERVRFTLNLGVYEPEAARLLDKAAALPTKVDGCILQERVGWVVPIRGDLWFEVPASAPSTEAAAHVHGVVSEHVLPWFASTSTLSGIKTVLVGLGGWTSAELLWRLGEKELAVRCVHEVDERMPNREASINAWKREHGLL